MKIIDEVYPLIKCEARLSDDGTLWIKTDTKSAEQTKRVLIEYAENSFCKTFYQDCDEPPTIPTFAESEEAYKAWTGEEMGGGRLIDRHILIEEMQKATEKETSPTIRAGLIKAQRIALNAPTVSADRPQGEWTNKHGEPIKALFSVYCSKCKEWSEYRTNYCGNCGAKMGGDGE